MLALDAPRRRELRALAHHLHPVAIIGHAGLTPAVLHEIDVNLSAHELIKVRVLSDDRTAREAMMRAICEALSATPVQHIGKLLVLFRPAPEDPPPEPGTRRRPAKGRPPAHRPANPPATLRSAARRKATPTTSGRRRSRS